MYDRPAPRPVEGQLALSADDPPAQLTLDLGAPPAPAPRPVDPATAAVEALDLVELARRLHFANPAHRLPSPESAAFTALAEPIYRRRFRAASADEQRAAKRARARGL